MPITGRKLISGEGLGLISEEWLGLTRGSLQYSHNRLTTQTSKMLITINRQKDSRDFSPHYFS